MDRDLSHTFFNIGARTFRELCYANWSYANSKYFQEINGILHTLLCFGFFNKFHISYLSEQNILIIKSNLGKTLENLDLVLCHDIMITA